MTAKPGTPPRRLMGAGSVRRELTLERVGGTRDRRTLLVEAPPGRAARQLHRGRATRGEAPSGASVGDIVSVDGNEWRVVSVRLA